MLNKLHADYTIENMVTERACLISLCVACCVLSLHLATAGCTVEFEPGKPVCGNGTAEGEEACDREDLRGETCESMGFGGGTLGCTEDCDFDTSGCEFHNLCGNNVIDGPEVCDGTDLGGETCYSQGFYAGTLACLSDCTDFDTSMCHGFCGDGTINGDEVCDGLTLGGETCESLGFYPGILVCNEDCMDFDTSGCGGYCGDGMINGDEMCDGADLGGETCESLGLHAGMLSCQSDCIFDTSGCGSCPDGWAYIPAGDFEMGCNEGDPCWENEANESPRHTVTLSAYCMQVTHVSVAQYRECRDAGGCTGEPREGGGDSFYNWTPDPGDREDHPINGVIWPEAREYCHWLGGDLPTEAQWEKAARGTDQRIYPWGDTAPEPDCDRCNWNNCYAQEPPGTWPVGYLTGTEGDSPYGLKDMAGNVWDFTLDCYDENFYEACVDNCVDPINNLDDCSGYRVLRGGAYDNVVERLRVVTRFPRDVVNTRSRYRGLRCAMYSVE